MDSKYLKDIDADIFDFDNIPMSELDKAYIDYEPLLEDVDFYSLDEDYVSDAGEGDGDGSR